MSSLIHNGDESANIPHLDILFDTAKSDASALSLTYALYPHWQDGEDRMDITRFTEGITNTLLKVTKISPQYPQEKSDELAILLRAYGKGTEVLIDRDQETKAHTILASLGLAPPLLASFGNGLIYKFIPGHVCTSEDLTRESIWRGVAKKLGEWHARLPVSFLTNSESLQNGLSHNKNHENLKNWDAQIKSASSRLPSPNLWTVMAKWIEALPDATPQQRERRNTLQTELLRTTRDLALLPGLGENGLVFGHNDLLSGNVIVNTSSCLKSPSIKDVSFIDYEYSAPTPVAFDLANHFAEWAGFECNYHQIPTRSQRQAFVEEYLQSYYSFQDLGAASNGTSHAAGHKESPTTLFDRIDRFRGVPGLYWGIWALIQATISDIDFDYPAYAERRLREYWAWRAEEDGTRLKKGGELSSRERRWSEE